MQIRRLIREMIMSEAYEHTDDEIVSIENIDLRHEFDKLNALLFDNSLNSIPLSWSNTRGKYGHVKYTYSRATRLPIVIKGLFITKYFKISYKKFKDILAHEMIHVKNIQDSMRTKSPRYRGDAHGYDFFKELDRINSLGLGFNVTDKEYDSHDVSDHIKGKDVYLATIELIGRKNGDYIAAMTPGAFMDREKLEGIFKHHISRGNYKKVVIAYYSSSDPYFLKYKLQRNFNSSVSYANASEEDLLKLEELSTFVESVTLDTNGSSRDVGERATPQIKEPAIAVNKPTPISRPTREPMRPARPIGPTNEPVKPIIKPEAKPDITDEMKEINRRAMAIFKNTNDSFVKEAIFDILKLTDPVKKQIKIDAFNQRFGYKFGYIN